MTLAGLRRAAIGKFWKQQLQEFLQAAPKRAM